MAPRPACFLRVQLHEPPVLVGVGGGHATCYGKLQQLGLGDGAGLCQACVANLGGAGEGREG